MHKNPLNKFECVLIVFLDAGISIVLEHVVVALDGMIDMTMPCSNVDEVECNTDLPPSYFPCLDARPGIKGIGQAVEVPFRDIIRLRSFCRENEVSAICVFQVAWALVLRCYLGNPCVCFASNRAEDADTQSNISVCQVDFGPAISVLDALRGVVTRHFRSSPQPSINATSFQESEHLEDTLPFNTCMLCREDENQDRSAVDRSAIWERAGSFQKSEITVDVSIVQDHVSVEISYSKALLSTISASNVAGVYQMAVTEVLANPRRLLDNINLLTQRDLAQIQTWNKSFPQVVSACVHDLVLQHAKRSPSSPSLCSWDGNLTYYELDMLTLKLAGHFARAGIRPEMLVPVCFRKSIYAIIAMVAIHRAGGAFVPLDPSHPEDRIKAILKKINAQILVASPETAYLFHNTVPTVIEVSTSLFETSNHQQEIILPVVRSDHAAFALFTSGSTGQPKGIIQEHASVCTNSLAHGRELRVTSDSRVFQYAAFTFDVSMMDIFTTLIFGGCVCIPSEEERMGSFTSAMSKMQVNWVLFTPSVASLIEAEAIPTLQTLVLGGEAVKQENLIRWVGKVRLLNCYGPAECGSCSIGEFTREDSCPGNIGRQYGSGLCWVVDPEDHNRLLPIGAVGELVVEGPTLARGYLDDLAKTRAVFIKSPTWSQAIGLNKPRRMYKTGDLVRQNSDGTFEFIGRKDLQLKVRGQRVELGEVEHHLSAFPGVALSVAAMPKSGPYSYTLVGLIQLQQSGNSAATQLEKLHHISNEHALASHFDREQFLLSLKNRLPSYMVPTHLLLVNRLPLSVSGKIDRKVVDAWLGSMSRVPESTIVGNGQKQNPILPENVIAHEVSSKILSMIAQPGSEFFNFLQGSNFSLAAVGLDSIKIISLTMFIRQRFGVRVQLDTLVDPKSTVISVANSIEKLLLSGGRCPTSERKVDIMDIFRMYQQQSLKIFSRRASGTRNVFLTGGTGFLGSRILYQLCAHHHVRKIVVHVRSKTSEQAMQRIRQSAKVAGWCADEYLPKLEAWAGDLSKPKLGLNPDQWSHLCGHGHPTERITTIVHNGATVDWNASWMSLKATNVDSTVDLLDAASQSASLLDFVYVSGGQQLRIENDDELEIAEEVAQFNGYAQTKFLSELIVKEYASAMAASQQRISVIKPGYIIGSVAEGTAIADDFIWRLTASCIDIKAYNASEADSWLFVSDVDRVALAISDCCCSAKESGQPRSASVVKILDGISVSGFWSLLKDELGYDLCAMNSDVWMSRISTDIDAKGEKHHLWPLLHTVEKLQGKLGAPCDPRGVIDFDELRVSAAIKKNIQYLISVGFLPKPSRAATLSIDITSFEPTQPQFVVEV